MKIKFTAVFTIIFALISVSCKDKSTEEETLEKMHKEVMEIHDEVMPKIASLNRMARQLKDRLKTTSDSTQARTIRASIKRLDAADEGMMNWMYEFKKPDPIAFEQARIYYDTEMEKIKQVRDEMNNSMEEAQKLLNQ